MSANFASKRLQDRVAIITGSSSGLGRAIAYRFAIEGAKCFLVDKYLNPRNSINSTTGKADDWNSRNVNVEAGPKPDANTTPLSTTNERTNPVPGDASIRIKQAQESTWSILESAFGGDRVKFHQADLTQEDDVQKAIQACVGAFSRVDILINSHGISVESTHAKPLRCHETSLSDFLLTQSINTTSLFLTCKHTLAQFMSSSQRQLFPGGRGWIVNVASVQGLTPYYATSSYCASKGAVVMLSKQIALDYAVDGGNADLLRSVAERQPLNVGFPAQNYDVGARGGLGNVEDIAGMVLVLASDDAKWMTGQAVVVDGGYSLS